MIRKLMLVQLVFCSYLFSSAQVANVPPVTMWYKFLGGSKVDRAYTVINTNDNGFLLVGESFSNDGDVTGHHGSTDSSDAWVVKLNASGNIVWQKSFGGTRNDRLSDAVALPNGEYILVGSSQSDNGDVNGLHSYLDGNNEYVANSDLWALQIGANGDIKWSKLYGGTGVDEGVSIQKGTNGGYLIAGNTSSADYDVTVNNGVDDVWLLKIDNTGNLEWQRTYGTEHRNFATGLITTGDGGYAVSGYSQPRWDLGSCTPNYRAIFMKVDNAGTPAWQTIDDFACNDARRFGAGIVEFSSGAYGLLGGSNSLSTGPLFAAYGRISPAGQLNSFSAIGTLQGLLFEQTPRPRSAQMLSDSSVLRVSSRATASSTKRGTLSRVQSLSDGSWQNVYEKVVGSQKETSLNGLSLINQTNYVVTGFSNDIWFDLNGTAELTNGKGDFDFLIIRYTNPNILTGKVFVDKNHNGVKDSTEPYKAGVWANAHRLEDGTVTRIPSVSDSGRYTMAVGTGTYVIDGFYLDNSYSTPTDTIEFLSLDNIHYFDIPLQPVKNKIVGGVWADLNSNRRLDPGEPRIPDGVAYAISYKGTDTVKSMIVNGRFQNAVDSGQYRTQIIILDSMYNLLSGTFTFNTPLYGMRDSNTHYLAPRMNIIEGKVFFDYNNNGIFDGVDKLPNTGMIRSAGSSDTSLGIIREGFFKNKVFLGSYTTSYVNDRAYYTVTPVNRSDNFSTLGNTVNFDFALVPVPGKQDLTVSVFSTGPARGGFNTVYTVFCKNEGTDTATNATLRLIKDNHLSYISSSLTPGTILNDTLTWNLSTLLPGDAIAINITLKVAAPPAVSNGNILRSVASVVRPVADITPADNYDSLHHIVTGSYDPNDKNENGGGVIFKNEYDSGRHLTYTVRFQNTGNDTAFFVAIRDTLDAKLDITTFEMISASHPYSIDIKDNKFVKWSFANILLPDSNINEVESQGYVTYRIKPKSGLAINDAIENDASIYFDYNPAVRTNTQVTIIKPTPIQLPVTPILTGLVASYCSTSGTEKGKIMNLPASTSGITVDVRLDANPLTVEADSTFSFPVYALAAGTHSITVAFVNAAGGKTVTHQFDVTAAITPDVNISSSVITITNLATPVVVTASSALGGGTAPKYTFAKDRAFANILQAEGNSNTLSVDPALLTIGDNWIFVKMKSNFACVATDIATDSIKLVRDMSTGITDPDNPSRVIKLYPNPSDKQLFVSGLSVAKKYTLAVSTLNGQLIQQVRVANRNIADIMLHQRKAGIYMLTIYDETKQRLLGTLKIIKR